MNVFEPPFVKQPRLVSATNIKTINGDSILGSGDLTVNGSGAVATDTIWDAAGDLAVGTGANTAARLALGTALQVIQVNSGATTIEYVGTSGTGSIARVDSPTFTTDITTPKLNIGSTANNLKVFASTVILSDDTNYKSLRVLKLYAHGGSITYTGAQFGGATASYPMLIESGTTLKVRLADDSADAPLTASTITASGAISGSSYTDFTEIAEPSTPGATVIRMWAEDANGFAHLHYKNGNGLVYEIARDNIHTVRNNSGATLAKGKWVYVTGSTGTTPTVALARADSASTVPVFGIVVAAITNNSFGQVMQLGDMIGIDTSAFIDGDVLYLSASTAGDATTTIPTGANIVQRIGVVVKSSVGAGIVSVFIGAELNPALTQTLSNKTLVAPTCSGNIDYRDAASNLCWTAKTTNKFNMFFGLNSGDACTTDPATAGGLDGTANTGFGYQTLQSATTAAKYNTAFGTHAGNAVTSGDFNMLIGSNSGLVLTTGSSNLAVGHNALSDCITGSSNTAIGTQALDLFTGSTTTAVGALSLGVLTTGQFNTAIGYNSGPSLVSGNYNNYFGLGAGTGHTGSGCTIIGVNASASSASASNEFVCGGDYTVSTNVYFGNGAVHATPIAYKINGTGGSGTNIAGADVTIAGGKGTGTGLGGSVRLQVAPAGSSGSAANALTDALVIDSAKAAVFSGTITVTGGTLTSVTLVTPTLGSGSFTALRTADIPNTISANAVTIALGDGNHQTLTLAAATGAVTVTLTAPSSASAGTIVLLQDDTARDITWSSAATILWAGTQPTWTADTVSSYRIISWRYDGTRLFLLPTDIFTANS